MNRELIMVIEQLGREKGIDREILFEALETALLSASRKSLGPGDNVLRLVPPLTLTDDELELGLAVLVAALDAA